MYFFYFRWATGPTPLFCYSDGDSYCSISLSRSTKIKTGFVVNLQFGISPFGHSKDRQLLELIQALKKKHGRFIVRRSPTQLENKKNSI